MSPDGRVVSEKEWQAKHGEWLPSPADFAFVASLMGPVREPGKFAGWIAPPAMGINENPVDFEVLAVWLMMREWRRLATRKSSRRTWSIPRSASAATPARRPVPSAR